MFLRNGATFATGKRGHVRSLLLMLTGITLLLFELGLFLRGGRLGRIHVGADRRDRAVVEILLVIVAIDAPLALPSFIVVATFITSGIALVIAVVAVLTVVILMPLLGAVAVHVHLG